MPTQKLRSALLSVYSKEGLEPLARRLHVLGVQLISTGGTQTYLEGLGLPVTPVEQLTGYPGILDGRVKTLHPAIFGGLLARRDEADHLAQLEQYGLPMIDCVVVDLYPFQDTVASARREEDIVEKIDIGGVSLIRAAAKNWQDVAVVPSRADYAFFLDLLNETGGELTVAQRRELARRAFGVTTAYDAAIFDWLDDAGEEVSTKGDFPFSQLYEKSEALRYGENPHQAATYFGDLEAMLEKLSGKALSYNNLVDVDAAVSLMRDFRDYVPCLAILKHTNACGLAYATTLTGAWRSALAADPTSAFGGIFITNATVDLATAQEINKLFYEVLIAPGFEDDALELLRKKEQRILLKIKNFEGQPRQFRTLLNGVVEQDADGKAELETDFRTVTERAPTETETTDLVFAARAAKHLKSNAIALVKNRQLLGMGCGQPSRVDALRQAIHKARSFGFDLSGAVMASDAFFPFPDCVEIAHEAGITAVVQPGGSMKDQDSVEACNARGMAMVMTGTRHFRH